MNLEKQNKSDDDIKKNKFTANNRYFTICIYTMFVIFFGAIIINLITSWNTTLKNIEKGLAVLMPFIIGALIAYILNPAVAAFTSCSVINVRLKVMLFVRSWRSSLLMFL